MKKNAFTLIELIAVITILGLVATLVFPAVNSILIDSKENAYTAQIKVLKDAAREYYLDHPEKLPSSTEGTDGSVPVSTLISGGYIDNDNLIIIDDNSCVSNPKKKNTCLSGSVKVNYNSETNKYNYDYTESSNNNES